MDNPTPMEDALDGPAARCRDALYRVGGGGGREQWVEATLDLAAAVAEANARLVGLDLDRWIERCGARRITSNDRAALLGFGRDLAAARALLEQAHTTNWRNIWEGRPRPKAPGGGRLDRRIPDVMRQDPMPMRPGVVLKGLTREQVDPDFKGTPLEFATEYGHVNLQTKEQLEHGRRQEALMACLGAVSEHERTGRAMVAALAAVDPATLREWTGRPAKGAKLKGWCESVRTACERLRAVLLGDEVIS